MTIEKDELLGLFFRLLPAEYHDRATVIMSHLDRTFFSYLKGISIVVVLYSAAITTTMLAAGLPFALPIGITAGLIQLVPIIGEFAAIGIPITNCPAHRLGNDGNRRFSGTHLLEPLHE